MFGSSKPVYLDYGRRRGGLRVPRWLVLLLLGVALGVAGVLYVQQTHLPPRLSAQETASLRSAYDQADAERKQLRASLDETTRRLESTVAEKTQLTQALEAQRTQVRSLGEDVAALVRALPPDPRGGSVEVRAGQFLAKAGGLGYELVLTRGREGGKPMPAVLQLVLAGDGSANVTPAPIPVSLGAHEVVRGNVVLPNGFRPRQATIQVLDRPAGRQLGMRVLLVQ